MDVDGGNKRVFHRLGGPPADTRNQKVCYHWQAGKCNRHPCPFLHGELPANANGMSSKRSHGFVEGSGFSGPRRTPNFSGASSTWGRVHGGGGGGGAVGNKIVRRNDKLCNYWVQGNCSFGDKCRYLHSWSIGDGFKLLSSLEGHQKVSNIGNAHRLKFLVYFLFLCYFLVGFIGFLVVY